MLNNDVGQVRSLPTFFPGCTHSTKLISQEERTQNLLSVGIGG